MNSPSHSAGSTIASFTSAVTNSCGGDTSTSIRSTPRNGCGEQLTTTRKLKPSNAKHKLAGERTSKLIEAPPRQSGDVRHGGENAAHSDCKTSVDRR